MTGLIFRRLALGLVTMWVVSLLVFASTEILPGDVAESILGKEAPDDVIAVMRERLGLNEPAYVRYWHWLSGLFVGDLGVSLGSGREISELIDDRLWNTVRLASVTAIIAVPLAVILGLISAMRAGTFLDRSISIGTLCMISLPEFFVAALLVYVFAVQLRWLPALPIVRPDQSLWSALTAMALPVMTLTFAVLAHMARMTRNAVINVLSSAYVEMALLKGVPNWRIILFHAFPNALSPIINVIALNLAYLVAGVVIVETAFGYPGLARLMVDAVGTRDVPLVQACGMIFCATYVLLNLLADILSILSNPRLRTQK
ncbi:ABC transporter permease [Ruegeria arenilitoris]|uniref:ABC transporter permease n=1 Tax=Ruegeria arenilitoris TaxID=1173585 RepID=UPI00147D54B5|nr:ABC transporter permease [Ruegeria arenilitoris]